jgi:hypothetical protein
MTWVGFCRTRTHKVRRRGVASGDAPPAWLCGARAASIIERTLHGPGRALGPVVARATSSEARLRSRSVLEHQKATRRSGCARAVQLLDYV